MAFFRPELVELNDNIALGPFKLLREDATIEFPSGPSFSRCRVPNLVSGPYLLDIFPNSVDVFREDGARARFVYKDGRWFAFLKSATVVTIFRATVLCSAVVVLLAAAWGAFSLLGSIWSYCVVGA